MQFVTNTKWSTLVVALLITDDNASTPILYHRQVQNVVLCQLKPHQLNYTKQIINVNILNIIQL